MKSRLGTRKHHQKFPESSGETSLRGLPDNPTLISCGGGRECIKRSDTKSRGCLPSHGCPVFSPLSLFHFLGTPCVLERAINYLYHGACMGSLTWGDTYQERLIWSQSQVGRKTFYSPYSSKCRISFQEEYGVPGVYSLFGLPALVPKSGGLHLDRSRETTDMLFSYSTFGAFLKLSRRLQRRRKRTFQLGYPLEMAHKELPYRRHFPSTS